MIVLVEGPDGAGKTTLINDLVDYSNDKKVGCTKLTTLPRDWPDQFRLWRELFTSLRDYRLSPHIYLIDRSFLSEIIYRMVMNDKEANIKLQDVTTLMKSVSAIVYCNHKDAYNFAKKRGEDYVTDELTHSRITNGYEIMIGVIEMFTDTDVIYYDLTLNNVVDVYNKIAGLI